MKTKYIEVSTKIGVVIYKITDEVVVTKDGQKTMFVVYYSESGRPQVDLKIPDFMSNIETLIDKRTAKYITQEKAEEYRELALKKQETHQYIHPTGMIEMEK